jgi:hypothetical protein
MSDVDDDLMFDEWLETGTMRRRSVDVWADQAAADELAELAKEFANIEKAEAEQTMSQTSPLDAFEARWDAVDARWQASKATFHMVRLTDDIRAQITAEFPAEAPPRMPGTGATEKRKDEFRAEFDAWKVRALANEEASGMAGLVYAIEKFESVKGARERVLAEDGTVTKSALSRDQLAAMFKAPYGDQWRASIIATFNEVSKLRGEPDRPFSHESSGDVETS